MGERSIDKNQNKNMTLLVDLTFIIKWRMIFLGLVL